jgi:DNA polymerase III epsilon subunit-like protein
MKFSSDIVIIDLEASCKTFGRNEIEESNIIEIGAVRLDKKTLEVKSEFSELIKPNDYEILPEISQITNITPEMVLNKPTFKKVFLSFADWYGEKNKSNLASFGIYYDLPLLRKEVRVCGLNYGEYFVGGGLDIRSLAIYWLAKNNHSTSGVSIEHLLQKMKIKADFQFHRALDDAKATALIFQNIMLG